MIDRSEDLRYLLGMSPLRRHSVCVKHKKINATNQERNQGE